MKIWRNLVFVLLILLTLSGKRVLSQNIYTACGLQEGLWDFDTVFVTCDVIIPDQSVLEIAAGTKVVFLGHYSMQVQGCLRAIGSTTDSILFTVSDTLGFSDIHSESGGWNGIRFENTSAENDSSLFRYCRFSYGKAVGDSANCYGGAFRFDRFSKAEIGWSVIQKNFAYYWGGGLYARKSHFSVHDCLIADNFAGNDSLIYGYGGGLCFVSSDPEVHSNLFTRNSSTGVGGGASFEYSNPVLLNCIFDNNYSALGGGLCFLRCAPDRSIANLLITNNTAQFFGGGVACLTAAPRMSNLTIARNTASMGGGYYCNDYADSKLYNSIIYSNYSYDTLGSQVWIWDVYSAPEFYFCAIQFGTDGFGGSTFHGVYENCIESDPLFVEMNINNFHLTTDSPCINSGCQDTTGLSLPSYDLDLHDRIIYDRIDRGAYEYDGPVGVLPSFNRSNLVQLYPNPALHSEEVRLLKISDKVLTITLFDITGQIIQPPYTSWYGGAGTIVHLEDLFFKLPLKGMYLLKVRTPGEQQTLPFWVSE